MWLVAVAKTIGVCCVKVGLRMRKDRPTYLAYLLRLWRVNDAEQRGEKDDDGWRASLQDPHTGQRVGFAGLQELSVYLADAIRKTSAGGRSVREVPKGEEEYEEHRDGGEYINQ